MTTPTGGRRRPLALLLAGALVLVAGYGATAAFFAGAPPAGLGGLALDDSWIHLAFARRLAAGQGLAYAPGETVTGSTAPLWTAALSPGFLGGAGADGLPALWAKLLGVAAYLALLAGVVHLANALGLGRMAANLAAGVTGATSWMVWSALSGMEVALFAALSIWGLALHVHERRDAARPPLALGVLGLAVLARPEGALLVLLAAIDRLLVPRRTATGLVLVRPPWRRVGIGLGLALIAAGPVALFYVAAGGSPLPTTFAVKAAAGGGLLPDGRYLYLVLGIFFQAQPALALLAPVGIARLVSAWGSEGKAGDDGPGLLPALWVAALPLAYGVLSAGAANPPLGNFGRYFFPLFPVLAVLALAGAEPLATRLGPKLAFGRAALPLRALLAVALLAPGLVALVRGAGLYAQNVADVEASDVAFARWAATHLPAGTLIAAQDVGALGALTDLPLLDLSGIVTPEVVERVRAAVGPADPAGDAGMLAVLAEHRPDLLAVWKGWRPRLTAGDRFPLLFAREIPGNVTMASGILEIRSTPWSRLATPPASAAGRTPMPIDSPPARSPSPP